VATTTSSFSVAARRAITAQALAEGDLRVALAGREPVGGRCSHWDCVPCKTLPRPGQAVHAASEAAGVAKVDVEAALAWRDFMVSWDPKFQSPLARIVYAI
jgi:pyruvate/2-oxoglutarate dehydrogenase complex dihydrolipoamide dehydrogenase (E3) component